MTSVTLFTDYSGMFVKCIAEGHSGYAQKGFDIVCSSVTVLLRTAMQILSETKGVNIIADTASRGNLAFYVEVLQMSSELKARLVCVSDFLRDGICSIENEYPEYVQLREQNENIAEA